MHWFRARRVATWLALFALACQLALTFGHVHLDRPGAQPDIVAAARSGDAHATAPASSLPTKPESGIGDLCAVCASIGLASTLLLPAAPALARSGSCLYISLPAPAVLEPASCGHVLFDARGPPLA